MFNLFNKGPKVRAGKQNNEPEKPAVAAGKKPLKLGGLSAAFKKLNSMDRKQAYTWGAVAVVGIVALLMLASMAGSSAEDDFSGYETRGYDLANMPFSADEAEQYLLASKYPDLKDKSGGLYTKEEKAARQEADAEQEAKEQSKELSSGASSKASQYVPGRYYGGGKSGSGPKTQVNKINSANLKSASGSGISGTFGPKGDFSNFRSQNKGNDQFTPQAKGKMNARQALFQTAKGSRAAAGLKNDKLLNAKKAMMGGNIKGGDAFANESGAVNIGAAEGLELDTNAPVSSADLSGLDDALNEANDDAADDAADAEETEWWQEMLQDLAKQAVQGLLTMGMNATQDAIADAKAQKSLQESQYQEWISDHNVSQLSTNGKLGADDLAKLDFSDSKTTSILKDKGYTYNSDTHTLTKGNDVVATFSPGENGASGTWNLADPKKPINIGKGKAKELNNNLFENYCTNQGIDPNALRQGFKSQATQIRTANGYSRGAGNRYGTDKVSGPGGVELTGRLGSDNIFVTNDGRKLKFNADSGKYEFI